MIEKLVALAALMVPAMPAWATPRAECRAERPRACENVNQLIWLAAFKTAVRAFARGWPSPYDRTRALAPDALANLGGPPEDRIDLADGRSLFTACRPRECTEKAAVLLDARGRVLSLSLLVSGSETATLHDYRRGPISNEDRDAIETWAKAAASSDGVTLIGTIEHGPRGR